MLCDFQSLSLIVSALVSWNAARITKKGSRFSLPESEKPWERTEAPSQQSAPSASRVSVSDGCPSSWARQEPAQVRPAEKQPSHPQNQEKGRITLVLSHSVAGQGVIQQAITEMYTFTFFSIVYVINRGFFLPFFFLRHQYDRYQILTWIWNKPPYTEFTKEVIKTWLHHSWMPHSNREYKREGQER